jgi:fatty-acyl-CoA synthase
LLQQITASNQSRLGRLKQPSELRIVESLPRSATGKLLRRALREML